MAMEDDADDADDVDNTMSLYELPYPVHYSVPQIRTLASFILQQYLMILSRVCMIILCHNWRVK